MNDGHLPPFLTNLPFRLIPPPYPFSLFYEESYLVLGEEHALGPLRMYDPLIQGLLLLINNAIQIICSTLNSVHDRLDRKLPILFN